MPHFTLYLNNRYGHTITYPSMHGNWLGNIIWHWFQRKLPKWEALRQSATKNHQDDNICVSAYEVSNMLYVCHCKVDHNVTVLYWNRLSYIHKHSRRDRWDGLMSQSQQMWCQPVICTLSVGSGVVSDTKIVHLCYQACRPGGNCVRVSVHAGKVVISLDHSPCLYITDMTTFSLLSIMFTNILKPHSMIILCFHLHCFHVFNRALIFKKYHF